MTMKRCLIFARTSTQDQENSNQILQLRDFIAKQGWELSINIGQPNWLCHR